MRTQRSVRYGVILALGVSVMLAGLATAQVSPDQPPGSDWWFGLQLQNVHNPSATATVDAYDLGPSGTSIGSHMVVIPGGGQTTVTSAMFAPPYGFDSTVVNSNVALLGVTNVTNRYASGGALGHKDGRAAGQYQGVAGTVPATQLNFPLVKDDVYGKTTTFYIQNAGATNNIQVNYSMQPGCGSYPPQTFNNIPSGRMVVVTPAGIPSTPAGCLGALTVTSTNNEPLFGVSLEHHTTLQPGMSAATILQATRGFTPADWSNSAYAPIIKNDYGDRFTGIQIQNVGGGPTDIVVSYVGNSAGGSTCGGAAITPDTFTGLAPGQLYTIVPSTSNVPSNCLASATISAAPGGLIVAVVNEAFVPATVGLGKPHLNDQATTYFAIPAHSATQWLSAPLYKENAYDKTTGLQVQNVGGASANNVVATFTCDDGNPMTPLTTHTTQPPLSIPAGGSFTFVQMAIPPNSSLFAPPGSAMPSGSICSVTVDADQPIVAIANESSFPFFNFPESPGNLEQDKSNYEAFNLPAAPPLP